MSKDILIHLDMRCHKKRARIYEDTLCYGNYGYYSLGDRIITFKEDMVTCGECLKLIEAGAYKRGESEVSLN